MFVCLKRYRAVYNLALERENSLVVALPFGFTFLQRISFKVPTVLDFVRFLYEKPVLRATVQLKDLIKDLVLKIQVAKQQRTYMLSAMDLERIDSIKKAQFVLNEEVMTVLTGPSIPEYIRDFYYHLNILIDKNLELYTLLESNSFNWSEEEMDAEGWQ